MSLKERFEVYEEEYIEFDRVENKRNGRPDIHAFLLLDSLLPGNRDMVCGATHDEIFLDVDPEELDKVVSDEQIIELVRCGVRVDSETDSLAMFA
jgi:hypothetical protein